MTEDTSTRRSLVRFDPRSYSLRYQLGFLCVLGLAFLPFAIGPIWVRNVTIALYFAMFAMSWDTVSGYTGQISFGHAFFFAIGGYTSALLNLQFGLSPLLSIPLGMVLAAIGGVVIGFPALRLHGPYLSLITLVAPVILLNIFIIFSDTFGGELGLSAPDSLLTFEEFTTTLTANYYLALALFLVILAVLLAITRSDAGAVFTAIREDEDAVSASGLNPAKFKLFAFVLSAAVGGLAGAVFVHTPVGNPNPSQLLGVTVSIEVIIASVLGGMGTIVGAAVGGLFLRLFQIYLGQTDLVIPVLATPVADLDLFLFAVGTLILLFLLPGGIVRWLIERGQWLLGQVRNEDRAVADGGTDVERTPIEQVRDAWHDALEPRRNWQHEGDEK